MTLAARRVVITGIGVVSALGNDAEQFWRSLVAGRSGIGALRRDSAEWLAGPNKEPPQWIGAEVRDFDLERLECGLSPEVMDRFSQFAVAASLEAIRDAGAGFLEQHRAGTAIILGTAVGGDGSRELASYRLYEKKLKPSPLTIAKVMVNASVGLVSIVTGITGPSFTVSSACSSATHAIGQAFSMIRQGQVRAAITGGSETLPYYSTYKAWEQMRVLSQTACRPFSLRRDGMVLGEGAGILVLEERESALQRGARIYAEVIGFGMSADACDLVRPSSEGMARAISAAIKDAGIAPEEVDYVNAHGTGTLINDAAETKSLQMVFGDCAARLKVSSTKSMHGHALGAGGALELIATALTVQNDVIPPTINFIEPDPACALDVVPNQARRVPVSVALSNSFAFGGLNAVLALRKFDES